MNAQKQLWEELARKNSRYYINSDKGRNITEEEFKASGKQAFIEHIFEDSLFVGGNTSIVDLGCGTGRMTEYMSWMFETAIGVDISGEMIKQAEDRLVAYRNVLLYETDGQTIPIPDDSVDYVFSYLVFQHMKEHSMVEKNFQEAYRVLKPGGLFKVLLRTDEQKSMDEWWSGVHYTPETAESLYSSLGFTLIKLEQVKTYAMWLWLQK
jgi:ubiquinone/menaquinone biosynthesis C-methylase UbiE